MLLWKSCAHVRRNSEPLRIRTGERTYAFTLPPGCLTCGSPVRLRVQGPVARSLVSANRWLRGIKMYKFPWYLTLVSTNHASSNPGLVSANRWLRGIKMYRFPWYLTLVSTNHASSNPGQGAAGKTILRWMVIRSNSRVTWRTTNIRSCSSCSEEKSPMVPNPDPKQC